MKKSEITLVRYRMDRSKETGRLYNTLFDRREKGDYGDYFRFQKEDVVDWLKRVEKAIEEIFQAIEKQLLDLEE